MIRTRVATAIAIVAAGSLALTACGSSSSPLDESSGPPAASASGSGATGAQDMDTDTGAAAPSGPAEAGSGPSDSGQPSSPPAGSESGGEPSTGDDSGSTQQVVIGSANFVESELLAGIYAAALQAAGVDATTKLDIGAREVYLQAIEDGSINVFPEYTGGLLAYYDPDSDATAAPLVYTDLKKALPDDLEVLKMSQAQDQDSVTVTKKTAEKYDLKSIADLKPVAGKMTLGGSSEWQTRADGPKGLKKLYGVEFKDYKVLDPGGPLSVKGLKTGLVQATDIFTTNPAIAENDFVVLKDPKALFQAQNVVPLVRKDVAGTVQKTLDAVSAKLTTEALTGMQKTINDKKADPADVGAQWVKDNGLG